MGRHPPEFCVPVPQDRVVGKRPPQARDYISQLHFALRWGSHRTKFWPMDCGQS